MAGITIAEASKQPDVYQVCKNGVIRDRKSGRFVAAGENSAMITPTTNQRMTARRWELARQAASAGLANVPGMQSDMDTIALIFENQAGLATDTKRGRASTHAAEFIMTKGGYTPDRGAAGTTINHNTLNVIEGRGLADLLRDMQEKDVIDME